MPAHGIRQSVEIKALTGMRALAAWWVVIYHVRDLLPQVLPAVSLPIHLIADPGYLGVDLFFILSGFVIAHNYWDRLANFQACEFRRFLGMRLARLYPVHVVTLGAAGVLFLLARFRHIAIASDLGAWNSRTFIENLLLVHHWMPFAPLSWNYPAWSISCEWLAYLAFPALVALLKDHLGRGRFPVVLGLLAVQCMTVHGKFGNDLIRISTEFPAGVVLWRIYQSRLPNRFILPVAGILCCGSLLGQSLWHCGEVWLVLAFPFFIYGITRDGRLSRLFSSRCALYWGRASYSLYMFHAIVSMVLGKLLPLRAFANAPVGERLALIALWFAAFGGAAALSYAFLEVPGRRRMQMIFDRYETPKMSFLWSRPDPTLRNPLQTVPRSLER